MCGLHGATPLAAPLAASDAAETDAPASAAESPVDVQAWIQHESELTLLNSAVEADRLLLVRQGWLPKAPTWIQGATTVNLGDFPTLDRSAERAARDIQTLEWVIAEQRRLAALQARDSENAEPEPPPDNWLRSLLPSNWIPILKANRDWVAGAGTALLVIVWGTAAFARRPGRRDTVAAPPPPPPRRKRRRGGSRMAG